MSYKNQHFCETIQHFQNNQIPWDARHTTISLNVLFINLGSGMLIMANSHLVVVLVLSHCLLLKERSSSHML
jgi:hypothetical protein